MLMVDDLDVSPNAALSLKAMSDELLGYSYLN